jgi:hypothetical protein
MDILRYPQGLYVSFVHGDGQAAASRAARGFVGGAYAVGHAPGHPFYERLNAVLDAEGFDRFVEDLCARFYAPQFGRPSLTPGIYFRSLLIGYFEGIRAERGIAWRLADSLALRRFVGIAWTRAHRTTRRFRAPGG